MTSLPRVELDIEGVNDAMYTRILPQLQEIWEDKRYDHLAPDNFKLNDEEKQLLTTAVEFFHWDLGEMREKFQEIVETRRTENGGRMKWNHIDELVINICRIDKMREYEARHGISFLKKYRGEEPQNS